MVRSVGSLCGITVVASLLAFSAFADLDPLRSIGGPPNADYLAALHSHGLQTDIAYLLPTAALEFDVHPQPPEPQPVPPAQREGSQWALIVLAAVALLFLGWIILRNSAGVGAALNRPLKSDVGRGDTKGQRTDAVATRSASGDALADVAAIGDRRQALQLLTERALDRAARDNGIRLGRSHTARDVMNLLPGDWRNLAGLRFVVEVEEVVRFGGEVISEVVFLRCLEAARPILAGDAKS